MTKKTSLLICLFTLLFSLGTSFISFNSLQADEMQYENQGIERIEVKMMNQAEGAATDASAINARIKTREGDLFCQAIFDNDLKILAQDFDRVDPNLDCINGKVYITLKVWPKPTIRTLTWNGNCKVTTKRLQKELEVASCSIFDRRAFNQAFHKLKAYYVRKGFFEAQLSYDILPVPETNQVDIQINIIEGRAGKIKDIRFVNFTGDEQDEILEMMITKEYNFFMSWLTDEGTYHEDAVQQDEMTILNFLQNKGYADARVHIEVCEAKQNDRIIITIIADKGSRYVFGDLSFKGNTLFCDEDIWKRFVIKTGDYYSPERIHKTIERISNFFGRYGYIDAVIDYEPKIVHDQCVYDIEFSIEEGKQFRVGLIKVLGNCSTQTSVILHETLLIPGEIFNIEKLKLTESRLVNIGFFKTVNVYAVKSDGLCGLGDNYRDVHIEVEETSTGNFGAFAGFSTAESVFGGFNITESNFNYKGLGTLGSKGFGGLRGGGEYAYFTATFGAKSNSYVLSWSKPWFMDTPWIVGFDIERSSTGYVSKDYDIEAISLNVHGTYQINQFIRSGVHYRVKHSDVDVDNDNESSISSSDSSYESASSSSSDSSSSSHDSSHHVCKEVNHGAKNGGLISAVGYSLIYDSTNHPTFPTQGFKSRGDAEFVGVGGNHLYLNFGYVNSYFWQFPEFDRHGVWKFRGDFHFIQPLLYQKRKNIPLDERFFLGGSTTVRGFRPYKLGPKFHCGGDPKGGISMQYLSLEYSRPLFKRFDVFYFIDAGHLSMDRWNFGRMSVSMGYGFRISIFPGTPPLVLGMGYPLNPKTRGEVKRFFLTVGGQF